MNINHPKHGKCKVEFCESENCYKIRLEDGNAYKPIMQDGKVKRVWEKGVKKDAR